MKLKLIILLIPAAFSGGGFLNSFPREPKIKPSSLDNNILNRDFQAQRALFINNYFYIIGDSKIVVLNENNWNKVNELEFQ